MVSLRQAVPRPFSRAFDGEEFLGVDGLVAGDEVGAEVGDGVDFLEANDGVVFGGEGVFAGVLGRAGFAFGGARSGGLGGVGAVGGDTVGVGHGGVLAFRVSMEGGCGLGARRGRR
jgi:hypothetical protein